MATLITDDFNSYDDGNLNGQGGWVGTSGKIAVQGVVVREGAKAIKLSGQPTGGSFYYKDGSTTTTGRQTFWFRKSADGTGELVIEFINAALETSFAIHINADGTTEIQTTEIGNWTADTWHLIEVEWTDTPSRVVRARLDGGTWSDYMGTSSDPKSFYIYAMGTWASGEEAYLDDLAEVADIEVNVPTLNIDIKFSVPEISPEVNIDLPTLNININFGIPNPEPTGGLKNLAKSSTIEFTNQSKSNNG